MKLYISLLSCFFFAWGASVSASVGQFVGNPAGVPASISIQAKNQNHSSGGALTFSASINGDPLISNSVIPGGQSQLFENYYRFVEGRIYFITFDVQYPLICRLNLNVPPDYKVVLLKDDASPSIVSRTLTVFELPGQYTYRLEIKRRSSIETTDPLLPFGEDLIARGGDIEWEVGLGTLSNGKPAGRIRFNSSEVSTLADIRSSLGIVTPLFTDNQSVHVIRDEDWGQYSHIEQIKVPQGLVDFVEDVSNDQILLNFYADAAFDETSGVYNPSGTPFASYSVGLTTSGLEISCLSPNYRVTSFERIVNADFVDWVVEESTSSGARRITNISNEENSTLRRQEAIVRYADNSVSQPFGGDLNFANFRDYKEFSELGELLVFEASDSLNSSSNRRIEYYLDASRSHSYGKPKYTLDGWGAWSHAVYNDITVWNEFVPAGDSVFDTILYYSQLYGGSENYLSLPFHGLKYREFVPESDSLDFQFGVTDESDISNALSAGDAAMFQYEWQHDWTLIDPAIEVISKSVADVASGGSIEEVGRPVQFDYQFSFPSADRSQWFNTSYNDLTDSPSLAQRFDEITVAVTPNVQRTSADVLGDASRFFTPHYSYFKDGSKVVYGYRAGIDYSGIDDAWLQLIVRGVDSIPLATLSDQRANFRFGEFSAYSSPPLAVPARATIFEPNGTVTVPLQPPADNAPVVFDNWRSNFLSISTVQHGENLIEFDMDAITLVPGESSKQLKAYNSRGELKREESWVYTTGLEWKEVEVLTYSYNGYGRLTQITSTNGTDSKVVYEANWNGFLKDWEKDVVGIKTTFGYDGLERVQTSTVSGSSGVSGIPASIVSTRYYDALDRLVYSESGVGVNKLIASRKFDSGGLLLEETDRNGLTTKYAYSKNATAGRQIDITYPGLEVDPIVESRVFHKNGRIKSVTGSAVVDQHYSYSYDFANGTNNLIVQTDAGYVKDDSTAHPVSRRSLDFLGRVTKEEWLTSQSQNGSHDFERTYSYKSDTGQLDHTTETEVAEGAETGSIALKSYYDYTAMGQIKRSGVDLSADNALSENSTDRLADGQSLYVLIDGNVWLETANTVYPVNPSDGDAETDFTSYSRSKLTGLDANTLSVTETEDVAGNKTTTTVTVDRANNLITTTVDYPDSDEDEISVMQNGFLKSFTSKEGNTTTYGYDEFGRQILEVSQRASGNISSVTKYEANKDRVEYIITGITDTVDGSEDIATLESKGYVTQYSYEAATGRLAWEKNPAGQYTYYSYNSRAQLEKQWGDATYPVWYEYDALGQLEKQHTYGMVNLPAGVDFTQGTWPATAGAGDVTKFEYYNESGLLKKRTDAFGTALARVTTYTYDQRDRLRTEVSHDGGVDDPAITKTYAYYPKTDELKSVTYSGGLVNTPNVTYSYHRSGDLKEVTETGVSAREFHYDFDSTRNHTDLQWLSEDLPDYYTDLSSVATNDSGYDHDRLLNIYQSTGLLGRLGGFRLGEGSTGDDSTLSTDHYQSIYGYDSVTGRFNGLTPEATNTWTYGYKPDTNLLNGRTLANSTISTSRLYETDRDLLSSIETLSAPGTSVAKYAYRYNALGNRADVVQTGSQFGSYGDGLVIDYGYNNRQEVTGFDTYAGNNVAVLPSEGGTASRIPGRSLGFDYDDIGNRKSLTQKGLVHNGVTDPTFTWRSNNLNQLSQRENPDFVQVQGTASEEAKVTVGFTDTADLKRADRASEFFSKAFDLRDSSSPEAFFADNLDVYSVIRDGWLDVDGTTVLGDVIDKETRDVWLPPAAESFTYDVRGNLKSDGRWDYTWDAESRLVFIETSSVAVAAGAPQEKFGYRYDYAGRRYAKDVYVWNGSDAYEDKPSQTTLFYYDGWNLVYEARYSGITYAGDDPSSATFDGETAYYWGLDWSTTLDGSGGVGGLVAIANRQAGEASATFRYPGYDGNGNLVTLLDVSGNVTASYEYGPYGELWRATGVDAPLNPFRFSTKYHDAETGLYYYGYRYYSPDYGRFFSKDPIGESGGLNLYAFVNNNPYNAWDYLGMFSDEFDLWGGSSMSISYPGFRETADGTPYSFASDRQSSWGSVTVSTPDINLSSFFPSSNSFSYSEPSISRSAPSLDFSVFDNIAPAVDSSSFASAGSGDSGLVPFGSIVSYPISRADEHFLQFTSPNGFGFRQDHGIHYVSDSENVQWNADGTSGFYQSGDVTERDYFISSGLNALAFQAGALSPVTRTNPTVRLPSGNAVKTSSFFDDLPAVRPRSSNAVSPVNTQTLTKGGFRGVGSQPYLYVVDEAGNLKIALRGSAGRTGVKHTQLNGGGPARAAGELQFGPNNQVIINAQSGRYLRQSPQAVNRVADLLREVGYNVKIVDGPL